MGEWSVGGWELAGVGGWAQKAHWQRRGGGVEFGSGSSNEDDLIQTARRQTPNPKGHFATPPQPASAPVKPSKPPSPPLQSPPPNPHQPSPPTTSDATPLPHPPTPPRNPGQHPSKAPSKAPSNPPLSKLQPLSTPPPQYTNPSVPPPPKGARPAGRWVLRALHPRPPRGKAGQTPPLHGDGRAGVEKRGGRLGARWGVWGALAAALGAVRVWGAWGPPGRVGRAHLDREVA